MPVWLLIPPVGALAVVFAARLRRKLRAAAIDRDGELRRQRDAAATLRLTAARLEVATEVHDTVAHQLVDINTLAGVAAHLDPGNRDNTLKDIKRISAQALADLRATLSVIRQRDDEAPLTPRPLPLGDLP
jgi:signal transduction histidine kinase